MYTFFSFNNVDREVNKVRATCLVRDLKDGAVVEKYNICDKIPTFQLTIHSLNLRT